MSEKVKAISKEDRYLSRPHFKEEKRKQKREWKKRQKEKKRKQRRELKKARGTEVALPIRETVCGFDLREPEEAPLVDDTIDQPAEAPSIRETVGRPEVVSLEGEKEIFKKRKVDSFSINNTSGVDFRLPRQECGNQIARKVSENVSNSLSRGHKMISMAKLKRPRPEISSHNPPVAAFDKRSTVVTEISKRNTPQNQRKKQKPAVREIERSLLVKTSDNPIGAGTFGQVFLSEYRGVQTVIKEIKRRNESSDETKRCKREVLHEATVLNSLGDHPNLPYLFGVCTKEEPFSLVLQFYGTEKKGETLYDLVKGRVLKKKSTAMVFQEIAKTLEHIHTKGFLHNDLKANNVLIDRRGGEFHPILIDFGKSKEIVKIQGYRRRSDADYIAPEVKLGQKESPASDVYSFGKMLETAVAGRSFCALFSAIISEATVSAALLRASTSKLTCDLKSVI